jgi:DNA-binding MarR family transcriptional regulator
VATASDNDPVVLARLVFEAAAGLRRAVVPSVERDYGLPQQSLEVLLRLTQAGGRLRMSDLAAQTLLTPSGLTRAIDRLCEAGLVRRQICSDDRRGAFALLTGEGSTRTAAAMSCHRSALCDLLGEALDAAEQQQLATLLRRLQDRLSAAAPATPTG